MINKILMAIGFVLVCLGGCCMDSDGVALIIAAIVVVVGVIMLYLSSNEVEM